MIIKRWRPNSKRVEKKRLKDQSSTSDLVGLISLLDEDWNHLITTDSGETLAEGKADGSGHIDWTIY